jgi:hypothetical protein
VNYFFQGSSGVLGQRNVQPLRLLQMIQDLLLSFRQSLARNRHFRSHAPPLHGCWSAQLLLSLLTKPSLMPRAAEALGFFSGHSTYRPVRETRAALASLSLVSEIFLEPMVRIRFIVEGLHLDEPTSLVEMLCLRERAVSLQSQDRHSP